jgi:two-component system nitrate/nitrite response regulator NarL
MAIKVLLGSSLRLLSDGLVAIISKLPDTEVVAIASDGEEVLQLLQRLICHVAILDVQMALLDGYTTARLMKQFYPQVRVILLADNQRSTIMKVMKTEVYGYVLKTDGSEELNKVIQQVIAASNGYGRVQPLETDGSGVLCGVLASSGNLPYGLTKREAEIIKLVAQGCSSARIAGLLDISPQTVATHRRNLIKKIGVRSALDIMKFARTNGLVE